MLISKIWNNTSEEIKEDLIFGLTVSLIAGLIVGLTAGLIAGHIVGLTAGLIAGLTVSLIVGLIAGLIAILINFKEALPFLYGVPEVVILILAIILISEILFWSMPKEKLKKGTNLFWHTCKRKLENVFETLIGLSAIAQVYILIKESKIQITKDTLDSILRWIGYIGLGVIILLIIGLLFYIWIKLNENKYRQ
jgi:hypothetical protein